MKLQVIGSHVCPDTLYALHTLTGKGVDYDFVDISSSLAELKVYLAVREGNPAIYDAVRAKGGVGIPCFVKEDGTITMDLNEVL